MSRVVVIAHGKRTLRRQRRSAARCRVHCVKKRDWCSHYTRKDNVLYDTIREQQSAHNHETVDTFCIPPLFSFKGPFALVSKAITRRSPPTNSSPDSVVEESSAEFTGRAALRLTFCRVVMVFYEENLCDAMGKAQPCFGNVLCLVLLLFKVKSAVFG